MPDRPASPADPEPDSPPAAEAPSEPASPPERPAPDGALEPSLRVHLAERWAMAPPVLRWALIALAAALVVGLAIRVTGPPEDGPDDRNVEREAARVRSEWAALRRQAPEPLAGRPVRGTLEPGDAEREDGRFVDYYAYTTSDSVDFSILVTSDAFPPDLAVRGPDGLSLAASNLLRTASRAEIDRLRGPGRFEVAVTSRQPGQVGAYELAVVPAGPVDSLVVDGEARADTLGGVRRSGRFERIYGIDASADGPLVVRIASDAFVPRVSLLGPNGEVVDGWRTIETVAGADGVAAVYLRYIPGWDAPYRLIVSSETAGERGPFAIDARSIVTREVRTDGTAQRGTLGDESWLEGTRYIDFYRFRARGGDATTIQMESDDVAPALRLWRLDRRERKRVGEALNPDDAPSVTIEKALDEGEYILAATTGGKDSTQAHAGPYTLTVKAERPEIEPQRPSGPPGTSFGFATDARRTGTSGGSTFEVVATYVAVSYPGGDRTRVQLSLAVRSVDYAGAWAPWESFADKAYVIDDTGRRYRPSPGESVSPSGPVAEPGTVRRGTVVFYADGSFGGQRRFVLVASIGENTLTIPISVP